MFNGVIFYKPDEVAQILRISLSQVYTLCREGVIPSFKLGRNTRISSEDLMNWLKAECFEHNQGNIL